MIDFSQLRISPWEHALDPVASAVSEWANRRHQEKMQEARLAEQRQQTERLVARDEENTRRNRAKEDRENRRLVGQQTIANQRQRGDVERQVRAAVAAGDMDTAEQIANSYAEADPETGDVRRGLQGFKVNRPTGPAPQMPANPVEYGPREAEPAPLAPPPAEEGPMATPEIARNAGKIRAYQAGLDTVGPNRDTANADAAEAERKRFEAQRMAAMAGGPVPEDPRATERARFASVNTAPADAAMAVFQNKAYQHQRALDNPSVTIGGVETTPEKLRYASGRQNAQDWNRVGSVLQATHARMLEAGDEQGAEAVQHKIQMHSELLPQIESGALTPAKAAAMLGSLTTADMKAGLEREKIQAALDRVNARGGYQIQAAQIREAGREAGGGLAEQRLGLQERKERSANTRQDLATFFKRWNAQTTQDAATTFPKIIEKLQSGNGKLQQDALIQMMRISQADNRFSDADAKLALTVGANWASQLQSALSRGIEGDIGDDVLAIATQAAQTLQGHYNEKNAAMNEAADSFLDDTIYDSQRAASVLSRELPGFRDRHPELFGKKKPAAAPAAGARPQPGRDFEPGGIDDPNNDGPLPGEADMSSAEARVRARAKAKGIDPDLAVKNLRAAGKL